MATWHQMQARKRPGFHLWHETKWTLLYDPPGEMSSAVLFETKAMANDILARRTEAGRGDHCIILPPAPAPAVRTARRK